jgi:hypothetical protein
VVKRNECDTGRTSSKMGLWVSVEHTSLVSTLRTNVDQVEVSVSRGDFRCAWFPDAGAVRHKGGLAYRI